jgi:carboxyl-terminal processing protease
MNDWNRRGEEIVQLVDRHFADAKRAGVWVAKHRGYASQVKSEAQFVASTNRFLGELAASHTGYFTSKSAKSFGLRAIFGRSISAEWTNGEQGKALPVEWDSPGADFDAHNFVRIVFAGGPAAKAGLRRGDQILKADGKDFQSVTSFQGRSGVPVTLTVQRQEHDQPLTIRLTPRRINPKAEWLEHEKNGSRTILRGGKKAAYVPMFSCAGEEHQQALQEVLMGELKDADALILDFRDGYGGCNPDFVNLFNKSPAVLTQIDRQGRSNTFDQQWRKRLILLINEGSTSGKEIVAYSIKKHRLGTLVGRRTAGAVLAGRCFLLSDYSVLYLTASEIRVDGERLEGVGVAPDVDVADRLPFADGADPQLDKAIEIATGP